MPDSNATRPIRIATRGSTLAMWQAHHVAGLLRAAGRIVEIVEVSTQGDRDRATALASMGGQGVFTREVQAALLDGRADVAVHSLKDLPTEHTEGLMLGAVPERAPMFDALILPASAPQTSLDGEQLLAGLPQGARIGTGSPRRQAQLLHARPDLVLVENRGNVETRLNKLDDGQFDAIILAEAGLRRLGFAARISGLLRPPLMLPAVGQGALGIECRIDDVEVQNLLATLTDAAVFAAVTAERSLLADLRAGCHAPLGVFTSLEVDGRIRLEAVVLSLNGQERFVAMAIGTAAEPAAIGVAVAKMLRAQGAERLLAKASG